MTEKTDADSLGATLLDWDDRLQKYSGSSRSNGVAFYVPPIGDGRGRQTYGAGRQARRGGVRPQERAPNYPVVPAECRVCGAGEYEQCFMSGAFQGCPRDLRRFPVVSPNPARDK
jgi:hypothetical protein